MRNYLLIFISSIILLSSCKKDNFFEEEQPLPTIYKGKLDNFDVFQNHNVLLKIPVSNYVNPALTIGDYPNDCDSEFGSILIPKCDFWDIGGDYYSDFDEEAILEITIDKSWLTMYNSYDGQVNLNWQDLKIYQFLYDYDTEEWVLDMKETFNVRQEGTDYVISAVIPETGYYTVGIEKLNTNYTDGLISFDLSPYDGMEFHSIQTIIYPSLTALDATEKYLYLINSPDGIHSFILNLSNPDQYQTGIKYHITPTANNFFGWTKEGKNYVTRVELGFDIKFVSNEENKIDAIIDAILVNTELKDTVHAKGRYYIQN